MTVLVRAASLSGYEALSRSIGLDPRRELARVGLSSRSLADPDALIPYVAQFNLMEHAASEGRCPDFGLRLAEVQDTQILGPIAVMLRHSATMSEALQLASRYLFVHSPAIQVGTAPVAGQPAEVDLTFAIEMPNLPPCAQTLELGLGLMVKVIVQIGQRKIRPLLALLPHARIGPPTSYARVLGCGCRFEAPYMALRVSTAAVERPLPEHNPLLQQLATSYIDQHFGSPSQVFADRVRMMVRRFIGAGQASQTDIARMLSIHTRTMQRRLLGEGHRFDEIVESVRKDLLIELLSRPQALSLLQIALMLGYSEHAALTRSCRRWFDCTPSELRERQASQHHGTRTAGRRA